MFNRTHHAGQRHNSSGGGSGGRRTSHDEHYVLPATTYTGRSGERSSNSSYPDSNNPGSTSGGSSYRGRLYDQYGRDHESTPSRRGSQPSEPGRYGTYITNEPQQYTSSQISSQHQSRTSHAGSAGGRGSTGGYSQPGDMIFHPGSIVNSTGSGSVSSVSERTRAQGLQAAIGSSASYAVQHNSNEQRPIVYGSTSKSGELVEGRKRKKANPFKKLVEKSKEKMEKLGRKTK